MFLTGAATGSEALITGLTSIASSMQSAIDSVVPIALGVAGSILVITVGYRLFRNFTH